jgi:hypothetical protein
MTAWGSVVVRGGTAFPAREENGRILGVARLPERLKAAGTADLTSAERDATAGQ